MQTSSFASSRGRCECPNGGGAGFFVRDCLIACEAKWERSREFSDIDLTENQLPSFQLGQLCTVRLPIKKGSAFLTFQCAPDGKPTSHRSQDTPRFG